MGIPTGTDSAPAEPSQEAMPGEQPHRGHRTLVVVALAVLVSAGIWLLIGQAASYTKIAYAIRHAQPGWLVVSLAGVPLGYLGYAWLYQGFAWVAGGPRPGFGLSLRLSVAIFGASVLATSAGRLGTEYWSLRRMREDPAHAWSRVLAINTAAWASLSALAFSCALALTLGAGRSVPLGVELAWLVAVPVCTVLAILLSAPSRRHLTEDTGGRVRRVVASALRGIVLLRCAARRRPVLIRVVIGALLHWAGELLTVWAALHAFGAELGLPALVVAYATGYVSTMIPLPAGGAGGVDAAGTYALDLVGVALGTALLATLVQRLFTYWLPLVIALVGARSMRRLPAQLTEVGDALATARSQAGE